MKNRNKKYEKRNGKKVRQDYIMIWIKTDKNIIRNKQRLAVTDPIILNT